MKLLTLLFRRETAIPVVAVTFASGVSVALVVGRIAWTWRFNYAFLVWNLFLAWLPLMFALLAHERYQQKVGRARPSKLPDREPSSARSSCENTAVPERLSCMVDNPRRCEPRTARGPFSSAISALRARYAPFLSRYDWHFIAAAGAWLLFFPNAPYIFTDLIHLTSHYFTHFWVDLVLVLCCAVTGLVLGFLSLYLMHCIAVKVFGQVMAWLFIAAVVGLSSFGIYLGRFLRFNSWDVIYKPVALYHGIGSWVSDPLQNSHTSVFPLLFATFLFISYVMLYALTHLKPATSTENTNSLIPVPVA